MSTSIYFSDWVHGWTEADIKTAYNSDYTCEFILVISGDQAIELFKSDGIVSRDEFDQRLLRWDRGEARHPVPQFSPGASFHELLAMVDVQIEYRLDGRDIVKMADWERPSYIDFELVAFKRIFGQTANMCDITNVKCLLHDGNENTLTFELGGLYYGIVAQHS